jgi:beta-glucosidase
MDVALGRLLEARFRLGLFDPPQQVAYAQIPFEKNDSPEHQALALRTARESLVLLKNNDVLPLDRKKIKRIAVIGTNANSVPVLLGNYNGTPSKPVTILDGIKAVAGPDIAVTYEPGCPLALRKDARNRTMPEMLLRAVSAAMDADVIIYVGGLSPQLEGEEMRVDYDGFAGGDRTRIELTSVQTDLLKQLHALGKPIVFVNCSGSAVAMPWEADNLPAILQVWYPGGPGGRAVADVLFGDANPAGRLPVTFYRATTDLPPFDDYSMSNRTYRYFSGQPLFAFGHGLSYTRFGYSDVKLDRAETTATNAVKLSLRLKNLGTRDGDEVPQIYFRRVKPASDAKLTLCGFARIHLPKTGSANLNFEIPLNRFRQWDPTKKQYVVEPGDYELLVGAASDDIRATLPLKVVAVK